MPGLTGHRRRSPRPGCCSRAGRPAGSRPRSRRPSRALNRTSPPRSVDLLRPESFALTTPGVKKKTRVFARDFLLRRGYGTVNRGVASVVMSHLVAHGLLCVGGPRDRGYIPASIARRLNPAIDPSAGPTRPAGVARTPAPLTTGGASGVSAGDVKKLPADRRRSLFRTSPRHGKCFDGRSPIDRETRHGRVREAAVVGWNRSIFEGFLRRYCR